MSLLWHNNTRRTCVENNTFIQNGGKHYHVITLGTFSRDKLMRLCFTEHIIKLTQVMMHYISTLKKDKTFPNYCKLLTIKFYKAHTQDFDNLNTTSNIGLL